jgi:hypothetical protein
MATLTLRPNGAGNQQNWNAEGGDYTRVDESSSDGDTTRLYSPTDNAVATFALDDPTTQEGVINSVTVYIYTRGLDPVSNTVQLAVRIASTDYFSSTQTYNNTSYHNESNAWTTNPNTGVAWTWADIIALEAGMKRIGGGGQAVTQVWVEVDYTPATWEQEGFRFRNDDGYEASAVAAIRGSSKADATTGTAVSVARPTGVVEGDLVVCIVHGNGQTTITDNNKTVSGTSLASAGSATDAASYATAPVTPAANALILVSFATRTGITANPNQPTLTGCGLTWVVVDSVVYDDTSSSRRRVTLFRGMGSSPSSGALTFDCGGQTQTGAVWSIDQFTNVDTSGTNGSGAIVQSANASILDNSGTPASSLTVTLGAFGSTNNATFGVLADEFAGSESPGSGFTQLGFTDNTPDTDLRLLSEWKSSNDTSVDFSFSGPNVGFGAIAVEIKANSGFTPAPNFTDYKPNTSNGHTVTVFYRTIQAGDPSTYNFTLGASGRWAVDCIGFVGPCAFDVAPNTANAANEDDADDGTISSPSITTLVNNAIHVNFCAWDTSATGTITTPSGYTLLQNANSGGNPLHTSYKLITAAGATGAVSNVNTEFGAMIAGSFSVYNTNLGATWLANQDTNVTSAKSATKRLRLLLNSTGAADPRKFILYFKKSTDGTYIKVPTSGTSEAFTIVSSSFIAASGEETTAQLTAPSGKSTSDFDAGRIQDDENPADSVTVSADDYTEMEWTLQANSAAVDGAVYQFRVYKYLETFTSELTTGGTPSALGDNQPSEGADEAFDDAAGTKWLHFTGSATWLLYDLWSGVAKKVIKYALTSANDDDTRDPKNWKLQGSNDNSTWTDIDTRTGETFASRQLRKEYTCNSPSDTAFRYWKLDISLNNGNGSITQLAEVQLYAYNDPIALDTYTLTPEWTIPSGTTDVGVSDTGSGSDAISVLALVGQADTGSGADAISLVALVPQTDSGSGVDTISILALLPITDNGTGVDSVSLLALISQSDTGSGSDAISLMALVSQSDTGEGVDTISLIGLIPVTDTGSGVETLSLLALVPQTDSGSGLDSIDLLAMVPVTDSGSGSEEVSSFPSVSQSDTGSGVDSISLLGMIPVTDNGVGVDTIEITGFIYVSDTGSGSDSVAAIIFPTITDSGSGVDEVSILGLIPVTDAGSGVDSLAITSYVDITDSGSGAEILEILNQVSVTDSLTATDAVSILALISQTDAGTGNEELQLLLQAAIDDVGNGVDTITVFRLFTEHRTVVLATGNVVARLKSGVKGVKLESGSIVIKL